MNAPHDLDAFACPLDGISLIEASAGTGKTWNICALYLRLLLERRLGVSQILVVTFTKAATAELRTRIQSRLAETLARLAGHTSADPFVDTLLDAARAQTGATDEDLRLWLDNAVQTFDEAAIFTIHSFCQRALADTPFSAGLPFTLTVTPDDPELRQQVVADFWRREVACDTLPLPLARWLLRQGDSPSVWAEFLRQRLAKPLAQTRWPAPPDADLDSDAAALTVAFRRARMAWSSTPIDALHAGMSQLNGTTYKEEAIKLAAASWQHWFDADTPFDPPTNAKLALFSTASLQKCTKKGCTAPQHPFFSAAQDVLDAQARLDAQCERARYALLARMMTSTLPALRRAKRTQRQVAYDDMLYNLHAALASDRFPGLAGALRARYPAALIDEFQDTDPLQFAVFSRIYLPAGHAAPPGPLFLVGDPKQAIYSFRNADLHTYLTARDEADARYTLRANQRSTPALIDACNALFTCNPGAFVLDGLAYTPVIAGSKPRPVFEDRRPDADGAALRIWQLPRAADGALTRAEAQDAAAQATADDIAQTLTAANGGLLTLSGRPVIAGDMAVLVRSHTQAAWIKAALASRGIGSVELAQASVFAGSEAEELERILAGVREPTRIGRLLAALSTGLGGHSADDIAALQADEAALQAQVTLATAWRDAWFSRGIGVMLRQWMADTQVCARLLAGPAGERRLTNLLHLVECLHEAGDTHPAPDALLRWLGQSRRDALAGQGDEAAQLRLESDRRLVQIVTIHKAKGLEYPIVYTPYLWDGANPSATRGAATEYHDAQGQGVLDFRPEAGDDPEISTQRATERAAEDVRLMYVALTRAVFRCTLVAGCYGKLTKNSVSLAESSRSLLNWLAAGRGLTFAEWSDNKRTPPPEDIEAAWNRLGKTPGIAAAPLPLGTASGFRLASEHAPTLAARTPPAHIPPPWRIGSFSRLAQGAHAERDHDGLTAPPRLGDTPASIAPQDILHFPRGARAGDCIHAVFEQADFTAPATWPAAIAAALRAHAQAADAESSPARHADQLHNLLADVLATPLPLPDGGAFCLNTLSQRERLTELGFFLGMGALTPTTLNDWLRRHGYAVPTLNFQRLHGFLNGFIDLVFRHEGRYFVLDWKSNLLGFAPDAYDNAQLEQAMAENGYHLQHLLYSVALQRHLRQRMADYDPTRHLGGVFYLFVRGVRPGWRQPDGAPAGVYAHRATPGVIDSLDALLAGAEGQPA